MTRGGTVRGRGGGGGGRAARGRRRKRSEGARRPIGTRRREEEKRGTAGTEEERRRRNEWREKNVGEWTVQQAERTIKQTREGRAMRTGCADDDDKAEDGRSERGGRVVGGRTRKMRRGGCQSDRDGCDGTSLLAVMTGRATSLLLGCDVIWSD